MRKILSRCYVWKVVQVKEKEGENVA